MAFIRRHKRAILIILAACVVIGAASLYWLKTSKSDFAMSVRTYIKSVIYPSDLPKRPDLTKGLEITGETVYVDGAAGAMPDKIGDHDIKISYTTPTGTVFCDYATGFSVSLPADMLPDITKSPKFVSFESPDAKVTVSSAWSWGEDVSEYIEYYFYRFLLNEDYRKANDMALLENTKTEEYERLSVRLNNCPDRFDTYTYLTIKTGSRSFFHVLVKYASDNAAASELPQRVLDSFTYFKPEGVPTYTTDFRPELPENWSSETRALYDTIVSSDSVLWGIYTHNAITEGIETKIPEIESKLDYHFGLVLAYTDLDNGFPTDYMERCAAENRVVELTLQATESFNSAMYAHSPWLELYKTGDDGRLRDFARAAKEFGKPFLFRLNNEMNSDWVNYGGVTNMLDPDIFIETWRTVYRIFEEEGVTNAIWIFNPHDREYPPNSWNNQVAYYPGNEYVQIYGITGYNNGTYYQNQTGEYWREFETIYDQITEDSSELFGAFPWMITEFSSSSIGGDKAKWIDNMFACLHKYPNIKAAVWFSSVDYDPSTNPPIVARPYWLDETDATVAAFKRGLEAMGLLPVPAG